MNIFAAQGELTFARLPDNADMSGTALLPENGDLILGHSETGHFHRMPADAGTCVLARESEGLRILRLIVEKPTEVTHLRPHDTHAPVALAPGNYEIRVAREYDPYAEMARAVAD